MTVVHFKGQAGNVEGYPSEEIADSLIKLKDLVDAFFPDIKPSAEVPDIALAAHAVYKVDCDQNRRYEQKKIPLLYPGQPGSDIIHDDSCKDQQ